MVTTAARRLLHSAVGLPAVFLALAAFFAGVLFLDGRTLTIVFVTECALAARGKSLPNM
jgi:hypothetical protein